MGKGINRIFRGVLASGLALLLAGSSAVTARAQVGTAIAVITELGTAIGKEIAENSGKTAQIAAILTSLNKYSEKFESYKDFFQKEYDVTATVRGAYYLTEMARMYEGCYKSYRSYVKLLNTYDSSLITDGSWRTVADALREIRQLNNEIDFVKGTVLTGGNFTSFERISMLSQAYSRVKASTGTINSLFRTSYEYGDMNPSSVHAAREGAQVASFMGF